MPVAIARPPCPATADGTPRRVGVEIEFGGLDSAAAAAILRDLFGGRIERRDAHDHVLRDSRFGDFEVALDMRYAHVEREPGAGPVERDLATLKTIAADAVGEIGELWLPTEITAPPLPFTALGLFDPLLAALRAAGARDTHAKAIYAFALQLNPEAPGLDADSILRHLRAFLLAADWLRARIRPDPTRRLLPFATPFPRDYVRKLAAPDYRPDLGRLIDDYIAANPTRNRELDLLPLFAHLDPERIFARLDDPLIKARPTYHYRLPDCRLADPDWSVALEWNRWVVVERLAADPARLRAMGAAFLATPDMAGHDWAALSERWLAER